MTISPINSQLPINTVVAEPKRKRYIGPAVASLVVPGAGQFIKKDTKKGFVDLISSAAMTFAFLMSMGTDQIKKYGNADGSMDKAILEKIQKNELKPVIGGTTKVIGALLAINILRSAYDAYKSKPKKEQEQE